MQATQNFIAPNREGTPVDRLTHMNELVQWNLKTSKKKIYVHLEGPKFQHQENDKIRTKIVKPYAYKGMPVLAQDRKTVVIRNEKLYPKVSGKYQKEKESWKTDNKNKAKADQDSKKKFELSVNEMISSHAAKITQKDEARVKEIQTLSKFIFNNKKMHCMATPISSLLRGERGVLSIS